METYYGLSGLDGDDISLFVSTVNRSLKEADDELGRRVHKRTEFMTEEERQEVYNESADESITLMVCVPFVNRAMLVTAYTYFEDSLKQICRDVFRRGLSSQPVVTRGFYIHKAYEYLESLSVGSTDFDISVLDPGWTEINDGWRHLRNNLVHDNAEVESEIITFDQSGSQTSHVEEADDAESIRNFVANRSDLSVKGGELVVESKAVESFLQTAQYFIDSIRTELNRIAPSPRRPRLR